MVEYLKDELNLSYHDIADLINRDDRNIWTVYNRVLKKRRAKAKVKIVPKKEVFIPLKVLRNRLFSVFEVIVRFLEKDFTNHEIAVLLNRSDKTIWTIKCRITKKQGDKR